MYRQVPPCARWAQGRWVHWLASFWAHSLCSHGISTKELCIQCLLGQFQAGAHTLLCTVWSHKPKTASSPSLQSLLAHRASSENALRTDQWATATEATPPASQHTDKLFLCSICHSPVLAVSEGRRQLWAYGTPTLTQLVTRRQQSVIFLPTHPCHFCAYITADSSVSTEEIHFLQDHILETQNHGLVWVRGTLKTKDYPPTTMGMDTFH